MEQMIRAASVSWRNGGGMEGCLEDMVMELYSYYLNSKNVYLIYKKTNTNSSNNSIIPNNNNSNSISNNSNNNNTNTSKLTYENNFISSVIDST